MTITYNQNPINIATGKEYRGEATIQLLNRIAEQQGYHSNKWGTMKQWNAAGETIARNQKGVKISFKDKKGKDIDAFLFNQQQLVSDYSDTYSS